MTLGGLLAAMDKRYRRMVARNSQTKKDKQLAGASV